MVLTEGLAVYPCHTWLMAESYRVATAVLRQGEIGSIQRVVLETYRSQHARGSDDWISDWRIHPEFAGGGILMDHGYHYVYLLADVLNEWPYSVSTTQFSTARYGKVEDSCEVHLGYPGGCEATIRLDWSAKARAINNYFEGNQGTLEIADSVVSVIRPNGSRKRLYCGFSISADGVHGEWYRKLYQDFGAALARPGAVADQFKNAVRTMEVLFDAYDSVHVSSRKIRPASYQIRHSTSRQFKQFRNWR